MPVLIVLYLLFVGLAALLAQMILPVCFPLLDTVGFGSAMIPLVVVYASLELGDERAVILAGVFGLFIDVLSSAQRFGTSTLVLCSLSLLIVMQAGKPESHRWLFRLTYVLVGTFAYLLLNYVLIQVETAHWSWPLDVWSKITFASLLNLVLCPLFFTMAGFLPRLCGWKSVNELRERRYAR